MTKENLQESKGGYNGKASYETTHVRVPYPIKAYVEQIVQEWKLTRKAPQTHLIVDPDIQD